MSANQPTSGVPCKFESGLTVKFTETFQNYNPDEWAAVLWLNKNDGNAPVSTNATSSNNSYLFTLSAATTTNLSAGQYDYTIVMTKTSGDNAGDKEKGKWGVLTVMQNVEVATPLSPAQQQLAALNTTILTLMGDASSSASFNGQSYTNRDLPQLMETQRILQAQVYREKEQRDSLLGERHSRNAAPRFAGQCGFPTYAPGCVPPWYHGDCGC